MQIRSCLLCFLFLLFTVSLKGSTDIDTIKINAWLSRALILINVNVDSAEYLARHSLEASEKLQFRKGIARSCMRLGVVMNTSGKVDSALYFFRNALDIRRKMDDQKGVAGACRELSYVFRAINQQDSAFNYCLAALRIQEKLNDPSELGMNYQDLGVLYMDYGNLDEASNYFIKAIEVLKSSGDSTYLGHAYNSLGRLYYQQEQYDNALKYFLTALSINEKSENVIASTQNMTNIAACYVSGKQYIKAKSYYHSALSYYLENGFNSEITLIYHSLGSLFIETMQLDSAVYYLNKCITLSSLTGDKDIQALAYNSLSEAYEKKGDFKKALEVQRIYSEINDSLINQEKIKQIADMQTKYKTEKKDKEISLLNKDNDLKSAENRRQQLQLYSSLAILSIAAFFLIIVFYQKNKITKEKKRSDQLVDDKEMLIKEIHHRVKNNLEVISSLLELQSESMSDGKAKAAIAEGQSRVQSIALIHHKLYRTNDVSAVHFKSFVMDLYKQVSGVFKQPDTEVEFHLDADDSQISIEAAVPTGLIINELLTNTFKYGINKNHPTIISMKLMEGNNNNTNIIIYRDNGAGMPEDFDINQSTSLGMKVIQLLTRQLGGALKFYNDKGSVFEIPFKNMK
ncbi:MAG: tetratricopeptide repeat protein [Bacteroidota bacterium]